MSLAGLADLVLRDPALAAHWAQRTAAFHGVVTWSPTCDPEAMKSAAQEMLLDAGVDIVFHAWGAAPVVRDGEVRGAVFESKGGRRAVLAPAVVDATGDGDLFHRAGAASAADVARELAALEAVSGPVLEAVSAPLPTHGKVVGLRLQGGRPCPSSG